MIWNFFAWTITVIIAIWSQQISASSLAARIHRHSKTHGEANHRHINATYALMLSRAGPISVGRDFSLRKERTGNRQHVLFVKTGRNWSSSAYRLDQNTDVAGNPLSVFLQLGVPFAEFLEYKMTSHEGLYALQAPTAGHLNSRIRAANIILAATGKGIIPIRFYRQTQKTISSEIYSNLFIDKGRLPIAESEDLHHVHDLSYHQYTVLLPETLLTIIRQRARDLRDYGRNFKDPFQRAMFPKLISSYIDLALGFNYTVFRAGIIPENKHDSFYQQTIERLRSTGIFYSENMDLNYTLAGFHEFCRIHVVPEMFGNAHGFVDQDYLVLKSIVDALPSRSFGNEEKVTGMQMIEALLDRRNEITGAIEYGIE